MVIKVNTKSGSSLALYIVDQAASFRIVLFVTLLKLEFHFKEKCPKKMMVVSIQSR